jgi:hypothetical protein
LADDVEPPQDPAVARLLPDASADREVATEFRRYVQEDLRAAKSAAMGVLVDRLMTTPDGFSHDDVVVLATEASQVAAALTDIRLVLAERLGLRTDEDAETLHDQLDQPDLRRHIDLRRQAMGDLYEALTWLQESLVLVMTGALPDVP